MRLLNQTHSVCVFYLWQYTGHPAHGCCRVCFYRCVAVLVTASSVQAVLQGIHLLRLLCAEYRELVCLSRF